MERDAAFVAAAVATVALGVVHAAVPALRHRLAGVGEGVAASAGGGVASAYVFLHLLPEVAHGNEDVAVVLGEVVDTSPVAELLLFLVAFAGFLLLYGLDHVAARAGGVEGAGVFAVHLGVFAVYNGLITYTLPTRFRAGLGVSILFVVAMALHFVLSDRALAHHHGDRFSRIGRPVLVGALVSGFLLAWLFAPTRTVVVSVLLALLGGFVLYNVFSDELPSQRGARYPVFLASAGVYAALLLVVTAAQG